MAAEDDAEVIIQHEVSQLIADAEDELDRGLTDAERDSLIDEFLAGLDDDEEDDGEADE